MKQQDRGDDASRCRYCGEKLSLIQRLSRAEFCNARHKESYQRDQDQLAISRIQQLVIEEREAELQSRINAQPEGAWPEEEDAEAAAAPVAAAPSRQSAVATRAESSRKQPEQAASGERLCGVVFEDTLAAVGGRGPIQVENHAEDLVPRYRVPEFESNPQAPRLEPAGRRDFRHKVDLRQGDQRGKAPEFTAEPPEAGVRFPDLRVEAEDWREALQRLRESYAGIPPLAGLIQIAGPQTLRFEARIKSPSPQPEQPLSQPVRSYKPGLARGGGVPGLAGAIRGLGTWRTRFGSEGSMVPVWESDLLNMTVSADWQPRYPVFYTTSPWDGEGFEAAFGLGPGRGDGLGGDEVDYGQPANVIAVLEGIDGPVSDGALEGGGDGPAGSGGIGGAGIGVGVGGSGRAGTVSLAAQDAGDGRYLRAPRAASPASGSGASGTSRGSQPERAHAGTARSGSGGNGGASGAGNGVGPGGLLPASSGSGAGAGDAIDGTGGFGPGRGAIGINTGMAGTKGRGPGNGWGEGSGSGTGDGRGSVSVEALAALVKAARQSDRTRVPLRDLEIELANQPALPLLAEPKPWRGLLEGSARDLPERGPAWIKVPIELHSAPATPVLEQVCEPPAALAPPDCVLAKRPEAPAVLPALKLAVESEWPYHWQRGVRGEGSAHKPGAFAASATASPNIPAFVAPPLQFGRASRLQPAAMLPEPWVHIQERDPLPAPVNALPAGTPGETRKPVRPPEASQPTDRLSFGRIERPGGQWVLMRGSNETATFRLALDHLGPQESGLPPREGTRLGPVARHAPAPGRASIPPSRGIVFRDLVLERNPVEPSLEPVVCQFGSVRGGIWQSRT